MAMIVGSGHVMFTLFLLRPDQKPENGTDSGLEICKYKVVPNSNDFLWQKKILAPRLAIASLQSVDWRLQHNPSQSVDGRFVKLVSSQLVSLSDLWLAGEVN